MPLEHLDTLFHGHPDLPLPDGDQALREVRIVLGDELERHHEVVDVVEHQGLVAGIGMLPLEKGHGVLAPVPQRVEVVGRVVTVVEAVTIALVRGPPAGQSCVHERAKRGKGNSPGYR